MAATSTVNTGQLVQWLLEYGQRVRDIQERAWVYSHASYVKKGLPLLYEAMRGPNQQLLYGTAGDAKAQKDFLRNIAERAQAYVAELQPLVSSLKIISQNFSSIAQLLAELHRVLGSLTLRSYPDLLHQYMETFCGAVKAGLLLEDVPRKAAAQMVQLACVYIDKEAAGQLKVAASDPIFTEPSMVVYMSKIFRASMPRIAQILELVVGPAMTVASNCQGVASAGLLEITQQPLSSNPTTSGSAGETAAGGSDGAPSGGGEMEASPAMGMFGMTRQQVYPFLRHRETLRQWGLLGFLLFPEILMQPSSVQRLTQLLSDSFVMPLYKDRLLPVHELMLQHVGPAAYSALGSNTAVSTGALSPRSGGGLGALFGKGMAIIGGVGRVRKSLSDDDASENRPPHPLFVEAAYAASVAAPLQHRMWRTYVTGQLRSIHAACAAFPSRIPGQMDMLLAALSLGREELLWFCRRCEVDIPQELLPLLSGRGLSPSVQSAAPTADDALQTLQLLSAMDAIHRLLVEHHSLLCRQIKDANGAELQSYVVTNTPRVEFRLRQAVAQAANASPAAAAAGSPAGANGLQPFKDLTDLLRSVLLSIMPPPDASTRVSSACGIWIYVSLQLASADPPLKAAKVLQYAENTRYLDVLQKSLDAARLLYEGPLLHASATDLAPGLQGARLEPLRLAIRAALGSGHVDHMQAALGAMQGLHWLLPGRAEAYAAATGTTITAAGSAAGPLLGRNSISSVATTPWAGGRNATAESPGAASTGGRSSRPQAVAPGEDLPASCMRDVMDCLRLLLAPVVMAPLRNAVAINNSTSRANHAHPAHPRGSTAPSLIRAMSRPKERAGERDRDSLPSASNGGSASGRSLTPDRVRSSEVPITASATAGVVEGPLSRNLQQLALGASSEGRETREELLAVTRGAALHQLVLPEAPSTDLVVLPSAAELAARLVPLVLALDNGRMLLSDIRSTDIVSHCRWHLLEAVRENFSQLIVNTASAISEVVVPVPSVQMGPLRLFVEVISLLQPNLNTELLPELARLLLQQTTAPTLQTMGLEAVAGPRVAAPAAPPPSTSAEAAAPTTIYADGAAFSIAPRSGSYASASGPPSPGPMTRSLNMNANPIASRSTAGEPERGNSTIGPMTKRLSGGGAPPPRVPPGSSTPAPAPVSVVRALHDWLWRTVVHQQDERYSSGVWFDAELGAFTSVAGSSNGEVNSSGCRALGAGLSSSTSVRELSLVFELFGPCAAADLTRGCDHLVHNCLEEVQAYLDANQVPLQDLLDTAHLPLEKRFAAVGRALPALVAPASGPSSRGVNSLRSLVDSMLRLGRCLALRMQLGRAAAAAAERVADFATLALQEMAAPVNCANSGSGGGAVAGEADGLSTVVAALVTPEQRREWAALLRLCSGSSGTGSSEAADSCGGGCSGLLLPERDDMLLTAHLAALLPNLSAAQRWHRLPALMAALMAAPQWSSGSTSVQLNTSRGSKSSTPRGSAASAAALAASGPHAASTSPTSFAPLSAIHTVTVALSLSLQAAMSQVLHPAASQFLMGCCKPAAAMLCAYQRIALAVTQAMAAGAGAESSPAASAARQHLLAALEQTPLLRSYAYAAPYSPEEAVATDLPTAEGESVMATDNSLAATVGVPSFNDSLELSQSWWACGSGGVGISLSGPSQALPAKATNTLVQIEVCEPSLAEGRWSGEVDSWRPSSRLLPLVMGHIA